MARGTTIECVPPARRRWYETQRTPQILPTALSWKWGGRRTGVRIVLADEDGDSQTLVPRRHHPVNWKDLEDLSDRIYKSLQDVSHSRVDVKTGRGEQERLGRQLFDLLLDEETKSSLLSAEACYLRLRIDDTLVGIPFELMYDGECFLGERFALGRQVVTEATVPKSGRMRDCREKPVIAVFGSGHDNLETITKECRGIRRVLMDSQFRSSVKLVARIEDLKNGLPIG